MIMLIMFAIAICMGGNEVLLCVPPLIVKNRVLLMVVKRCFYLVYCRQIFLIFKISP